MIADDPWTVWSNFEIGDLEFWRGEAYSKFFDFLDEKGGFYYEVLFHVSRHGKKLINSSEMGRRTHPYHRSGFVCSEGSDCMYLIMLQRSISHFLSIFSMILATSTSHFSTARKVIFTRRDDVGAIPMIASVSSLANYQKTMPLNAYRLQMVFVPE